MSQLTMFRGKFHFFFFFLGGGVTIIIFYNYNLYILIYWVVVDQTSGICIPQLDCSVDSFALATSISVYFFFQLHHLPWTFNCSFFFVLRCPKNAKSRGNPAMAYVCSRSDTGGLTGLVRVSE